MGEEVLKKKLESSNIVGTYFGAGFKIKGLGYFGRYIKPSVFLLPINIIEDFSKPLSLNFRLFGNIVADERSHQSQKSDFPDGNYRSSLPVTNLTSICHNPVSNTASDTV